MEIAIKILSQHPSSMVPKENAIRIDHWYNIEIKMFSQEWRF